MVYTNFTKVILAILTTTSIFAGTTTTSFAQGITISEHPTGGISTMHATNKDFSRNQARIQEIKQGLDSIIQDIKGTERSIENLVAKRAIFENALKEVEILLDKAQGEKNEIDANRNNLSPKELALAKAELAQRIQSIIDDRQYPTEEIARISKQIIRLNSDMDLILYERKQELDKELAKINAQQKAFIEEKEEVVPTPNINSSKALELSSRERSELYNNYRRDRLEKHIEKLASTGRFTESELADKKETLKQRLKIRENPATTTTVADDTPHVGQAIRIGGLSEEAGAAAIQRAQDIIRFRELGEDMQNASTPEEREEAIMALRAQADIVRDGARGITHLDPNPTQEATHKTPEQIAAIQKAQDIIDLRHKAETIRSATTPEQRTKAQEAFRAQADIVRNNARGESNRLKADANSGTIAVAAGGLRAQYYGITSNPPSGLVNITPGQRAAAIQKAQDIINLRHAAEATRSATTQQQRIQAQKAFSAQADVVRNGRAVPTPIVQKAETAARTITPQQAAALQRARDIIALRHAAKDMREAKTPEQKAKAAENIRIKADIVRNGR